jgi:TPR repeat protein
VAKKSFEEVMTDFFEYVAERANSAYNEKYASFVKDAEEGDPKAQYQLATLIDKDTRRGQKCSSEAIEWYRRAAEGGQVEAQSRLGIICLNGLGVKQDRSQAIRWLRSAAEGGDAQAQFFYGELLEIGEEPIKRDLAEAAKWYRLASEGGESLAQFKLGLFLAYGLGGPKNRAEAIKWLRLSLGRDQTELSPKDEDLDSLLYEAFAWTNALYFFRSDNLNPFGVTVRSEGLDTSSFLRNFFKAIFDEEDDEDWDDDDDDDDDDDADEDWDDDDDDDDDEDWDDDDDDDEDWDDDDDDEDWDDDDDDDDDEDWGGGDELGDDKFELNEEQTLNLLKQVGDLLNKFKAHKKKAGPPPESPAKSTSTAGKKVVSSTKKPPTSAKKASGPPKKAPNPPKKAPTKGQGGKPGQGR